MKDAIVIEEITKNFKELCAVDHVSLKIKEGEIFGLLGVNGAGKTTLIRMLSCLSRPTSGDAQIMGLSLTKDSAKIKEIINVSPQETAVAGNLSVKENLEFIASLYYKDKKIIKEKAEGLIEKFNLGEVAKKRARLLSGGMQRRLSIAMALVSDPKILFLDEPTLGLDVIARKELWNVIKDLKKSITIILTTHYMEEAENLADRIAIMVKGKLVALGTVKQLKKQTGESKFEDAFIKIAEGGVL